MRIRKGVVALVGAGLLASAGGVSYAIDDIGNRVVFRGDACRVNQRVTSSNDDGIGGGRNRAGARGGCTARVGGIRIRG